jgi:EmrB/QacA subfamily drug resistance transporter
MSAAQRRWTLGIASSALFMVVLDNLVVSIALPSIRRDLGASLGSLEWTVNAYVLTYAVLLLTGAALGDRFGRKRIFIVGLAIFTGFSAAAALAPSSGLLIAARALQGSGAAVATPLTLTLLAEAFPGSRRGLALGIWSGVSGTAVAIGPLVGGAVVEGISWHWIFWINVPIGLVLLPLAAINLRESHGPRAPLDIGGLALGSGGLFALVYALIRAQSIGFGAAQTLILLALAAALLGAFIAFERRTAAPMLPMGFFARRAFAVTNVASLAMYFGMFGSIFFLTQFLQDVLHNRPLQAGLKVLVWTGATMVVSPLAGVLAARFGSRPFIAAGLALQAGALAALAALASTRMSYAAMIGPFIMAGAGMALVFAPAANAVLSAVAPEQAGQASGATNAIREVGGVLGVSVLASVFASAGSYADGAAFANGLVSALWVAVAVLGAGALVVWALPFGSRAQTAESGQQRCGGRLVAAEGA